MFVLILVPAELTKERVQNECVKRLLKKKNSPRWLRTIALVFTQRPLLQLHTKSQCLKIPNVLVCDTAGGQEA